MPVELRPMCSLLRRITAPSSRASNSSNPAVHSCWFVHTGSHTQRDRRHGLTQYKMENAASVQDRKQGPTLFMAEDLVNEQAGSRLV